MTNTYDSLNKDLKLEYKGFGQYDLKIEDGDFVRVNGLESLSTGITIAVMMGFGELFDNPTYQNSGNKAWLLVAANKTPLTIVQIKEYTKSTLEAIRRVRSIDTLTVSEDLEKEETVNITFSGTAINDQTFSGGFDLCQM